MKAHKELGSDSVRPDKGGGPFRVFFLWVLRCLAELVKPSEASFWREVGDPLHRLPRVGVRRDSCRAVGGALSGDGFGGGGAQMGVGALYHGNRRGWTRPCSRCISCLYRLLLDHGCPPISEALVSPGPMVYGCLYCARSYQKALASLNFAGLDTVDVSFCEHSTWFWFCTDRII